MSKYIILQTIEYLNEVTGADFNPHYPETMDAIKKLLELGYGIEEFKKVIDKKWDSWKNTKFQMYVRPSTLFGKNFENYLNEPTATKNQLTKLFDSVNRAKQTNWKLDKK